MFSGNAGGDGAQSGRPNIVPLVERPEAICADQRFSKKVGRDRVEWIAYVSAIKPPPREVRTERSP